MKQRKTPLPIVMSFQAVSAVFFGALLSFVLTYILSLFIHNAVPGLEKMLAFFYGFLAGYPVGSLLGVSAISHILNFKGSCLYSFLAALIAAGVVLLAYLAGLNRILIVMLMFFFSIFPAAEIYGYHWKQWHQE